VPGTFSWVDLGTTDGAAAKAFYAGVFGWHFDDAEAGAEYTICRLDGDAVCGLYEVSDEMRVADGPPAWMSYVTVENAASVAARTKQLGGEVVEDAFDVMDAGRTAVLRDPQGAFFSVWQPNTLIGADRVNDVGCLCMNELVTTDVAASAAFYEALFGWNIDLSAAAPDVPSMVFNRGNINAAVFAAPERLPSHWRACFTVESTEKALERVQELGGRKLLDPVEIGHGSIAMARDPQGALFSIFAGETHP
jgi:uncharacterized protein